MLYKTLFLFSPDEPVINTLPASSGRIANVNDVLGIVDEKALLVGLGDSATQTVEGSIDVTGSLYEDGVSVLTESNVTTSITEDSSDIPTSGAVYDELQNYATKGELPTDTNYYPTSFSWTNGTTSGPTGTLSMSGTSNVSFGAMPVASSSTSGVVTTGTQTFAGRKTFSDSPIMMNHINVVGNNDDSNVGKPTNHTDLTGHIDTTYWNTGISVYDIDNDAGYQYSFPNHSGTFALLDDIAAASGCLALAGGTMDDDAVVHFKSANDNGTAHIDSNGFRAATMTGHTASNWSSMTTTYAYDAINIESKGKRTGPNHKVTEWDYIYKLNLPLKGRIVESGDTGATLLTDESLKTINGQSLVGSGDIVIDKDETERTFSTHGSAQFFKTFNLHIANSDYAYDSSHASDIDILDAFSENIEHFGLAICRFGNTRTLNPMKNGGQQRKGWFIEPNICKRGRCNITGFSQNDDAYVTSYSMQDLIEFVFDGMKYKSGDSLINLMPTLSLLLKSKTYRSKTYDSLKKGYADAQELVFEIENTSTIDVPIKPSIARATSNYLTFDSNKLSSTTQIGTGGFSYDKVVASVKFNLLIGEWGSIYINTSSKSSFHGYHPRCMWTDAMKTFIALKTPSASGKNWRLIIQFASAK